MKSEKFNVLEKYIFLLITGLNLIPVFSSKFFPTYDGAAHLYNSQLIQSLLFDSNALLKSFFVFNQEPVPNWTGHIILSFFGLFFPAFVAEKVLLVFYLAGLPLAFRAVVTTIAPRNGLFSYLIFPFTYSFVFLMGFYNFSIAIVFLFITLYFWIRHEDAAGSVRNILKLSVLVILTYFSHIVIFVILLFMMGLFTAAKATIRVIGDPAQIKQTLADLAVNLGWMLLSSVIPLALFLYYFYNRPSDGGGNYLETEELVNWLCDIRHITAFNAELEKEYTITLFYLIFSVTVVALYKRISQTLGFDFLWRGRWTAFAKSLVRISDVWLITAILMLYLYFKVPDTLGSAGYLSMRLGLLFFLFLIGWLCMQDLQRWFGLIVMAVTLYCNFSLNNFYSSMARFLSKEAMECVDAAQHIPPHSIVLPLNYSGNWLHWHFSNYLGVDKPLVILENYEALTGYFPLKWSEATMPNSMLGNTEGDDYPCVSWLTNAHNRPAMIDFVFVIGNMDIKVDSCNQRIRQVLHDYYTPVYKSHNCKLYQKKN